MCLFLIRRWRAKKLAKHADHQISQTRLFLDARGAEMDRKDREFIERRLIHAADLRHGLVAPRWAQFEQAMLFCNYADETLRDIERLLPPPPSQQIQTQTEPLRRRINS